MNILSGEYRIRQVNRHGESKEVPIRNERFYLHREDWYFTIRRGVDQGPFASEHEAREALRNFIEEQLEFEHQLQKGRTG
ncbi:MAG: DUF6316 family protein [Gammaproteobacteria bacterium]|nr:DUF6316 family protein [Gammaproteobacteria bacterium]